jgi:hypothetical protein
MSEIEYERIGIDEVYAWTTPILEHKRNIIGSIFKKMIECIKTHTIYINFVESRKVHYGDYYKNRVRLWFSLLLFKFNLIYLTI